MRIAPKQVFVSLLAVVGVLTFGLWSGSPRAADIINQRDPAYLASLEALLQARQALDSALERVRESQRQHAMHNIDYRRLQSNIAAVRDQLHNTITPQQEPSLRHRPIFPDSTYFLPPKTEQRSQ